MRLERLDVGEKFPEEVNVVIEIPMGSKNKYEYDMELGVIVLDRVLHGPFRYPTNYGFIPKTWSKDEDTLDVIVFSSTPLHPYTVVKCKVVGLFKMRDEEGLDYKIVAVPKKDPVWNFVEKVEDIPEFWRKEVEFFFRRYKELEKGKWSEVEGWGTKEEAFEYLKECRERFRGKFGE